MAAVGLFNNSVQFDFPQLAYKATKIHCPLPAAVHPTVTDERILAFCEEKKMTAHLGDSSIVSIRSIFKSYSVFLFPISCTIMVVVSPSIIFIVNVKRLSS